jgi:hypothetical protein
VYLTREQCDAVVDLMRSGDTAAIGLWVAFEGLNFGDFLSFLQPLQVIACVRAMVFWCRERVGRVVHGFMVSRRDCSVTLFFPQRLARTWVEAKEQREMQGNAEKER